MLSIPRIAVTQRVSQFSTFHNRHVGDIPVNERTLVIVKPDAMTQESHVLAQILAEYLRWSSVADNNHPHIIDLRYFEQLPTKTVHALYREHEGKPYYEMLVNFMRSGPVVVLVLEGNDIIRLVRTLNGATNPEKADPGTLRERFGMKGPRFTGQQNAVHASDSPESAAREIGIFFPDLQ